MVPGLMLSAAAVEGLMLEKNVQKLWFCSGFCVTEWMTHFPSSSKLHISLFGPIIPTMTLKSHRYDICLEDVI